MVQKFAVSSHSMIMEHSLRSNSSYIGKDKSKLNQFYPNIEKPGTDIHSVLKKVESESQQDYLFLDFRWFLIVGKIIGVLPFSGVFGYSSKHLSLRRKSLTSIVSYMITTILIFNGMLGFWASFKAPKRNALEIATSIRATLFFAWGCFIYITFIVRGEYFLDIFYSWNLTQVVYSRKDKTLKRDSILIGSVILTSAILENAVLHLEYINSLDSISGGKYNNMTIQSKMNSVEAFYRRSNEHWGNVIGYNWFFAILAFIQHKWNLYAWNYLDILIAIFGRAMYYRFKSLLITAKSQLLVQKEQKNSISFTDENIDTQKRQAWIQVVTDHKHICGLLDVLENFFSPVIFGSYAINMFYICLQLMDGLTVENSPKSIVHNIYAPWSFLHLLMRTFIVSICLARVNVYAHGIRKIFQQCPVEYYSAEISRVDTKVMAGPAIGLTGLGCFVVTKPFILSFLSVIFTFEIVLLQCVPTIPTTPSQCCCPPGK